MITAEEARIKSDDTVDQNMPTTYIRINDMILYAAKVGLTRIRYEDKFLSGKDVAFLTERGFKIIDKSEEKPFYYISWEK